MRSIAFYGKGGIGKSTVASNVSLLFRRAGLRVLQIGCDPKHDSAQHHVDAEKIVTVMQRFRGRSAESPLALVREVLMKGRTGVDCIEAGGPEPGTGCAGRSISLLLDVFDLDRTLLAAYDVVVYDVLGDVVCGGFATPIRKGHADELFVVTSGEIMSLYAANNIVKGFVNLAGAAPKPIRIVANMRGVPGEEALIARFSAAVRVPVAGAVPHDTRHVVAEARGGTVVELYPGSSAAAAAEALFAAIKDPSAPGTATPDPMDQTRWNAFVRDAALLIAGDAP